MEFQIINKNPWVSSYNHSIHTNCGKRGVRYRKKKIEISSQIGIVNPFTSFAPNALYQGIKSKISVHMKRHLNNNVNLPPPAHCKIKLFKRRISHLKDRLLFRKHKFFFLFTISSISFPRKLFTCSFSFFLLLCPCRTTFRRFCEFHNLLNTRRTLYNLF